MIKTRRRAWRPLGAVLFSATLLLAACGEKPQEQSMSGMKVPVNVVQVKPEVTTIYTELPGRVEAIEEAQVRARVTGILTAYNFEQGSEVKEGELLFTIDPAPYEAVRDQARAQLSNAEAQASTARALAQRYSKLIKENAISRQEYDAATAGAQQAEAAIAAAKATLKSAEIDLGYTQVTAPISGRIGGSEVPVGALVSAAEATQLATIQQLNDLYINISRPVSEVMSLRKAIADGTLKSDPEGAATVTAILDDQSTYSETGKLLFSGVSVDPTTGQLRLRAVFPNPDQLLLPGMFVRVRLEQGIDEQALLVPAQALQYASDDSVSVFLVEDGVAKPTPVKLGEQVGGRYIIHEGIAADDTVIVTGFQKIRPGAPVQPLPWEEGLPADQPEPDAVPESASKPESKPASSTSNNG